MDCYLLTIYVSVEQELAIRELFAYNGWNFSKYEGPSISLVSKQDDSASLVEKQVQESQSESPEKVVIEEDGSLKNVDIVSSPQVEIFSDLQHFVEATLIAVGTDNNKPEGEQNANEAKNVTSGGISGIKQSCRLGFVKGTKRGFTSKDDVCKKSGTSVSVAGTDRFSTKVCESGTRNVENSPNGSNSFCDSVMVDGHASDINSSDGSYDRESENDVNVNHAFMETNDNTSFSKSAENESVKSSPGNLVLQGNTETIQSNIQIRNETKSGLHMKKFEGRGVVGRKKNLKIGKVKESGSPSVLQGLYSNKKSGRVGEFHCKECNNTFRLLGAYKNHKRDGRCLFECEYCGKIFTARYYSNYKSHMKYHLKERPHKCDVCGKTYIEAQTLKIHMRKHSGDRPYVCHHCGLQFYSSSHLLSHRNSVHSNMRQIHKCDICDATLSTLGNLRVHKKVVHAIDRPFTCEICGKSFKTQKSLEQVHAKVHSEDFPYKCEFLDCSKVFKRAEGLTDHMRRHNNDRNHFCERCGKGFYTNKDLMLHTRTHTGEKPHQCHLCDYKCALGGNLRKHMKTHQP